MNIHEELIKDWESTDFFKKLYPDGEELGQGFGILVATLIQSNITVNKTLWSYPTDLGDFVQNVRIKAGRSIMDIGNFGILYESVPDLFVLRRSGLKNYMLGITLLSKSPLGVYSFKFEVWSLQPNQSVLEVESDFIESDGLLIIH